MDPERCLLNIRESIRCGKYRDAVEGLEAYSDWRYMDGSEPSITFVGRRGFRHIRGDNYRHWLIGRFVTKFGHMPDFNLI